jgi:hypothetical protein
MRFANSARGRQKSGAPFGCMPEIHSKFGQVPECASLGLRVCSIQQHHELVFCS